MTEHQSDKPFHPPLQESESLHHLEKLLTQQVMLYANVEQHMQCKRQILVEGDIHRLAQIDQDLIRLAQQLTHLEQERLDLLTHMGYQDKTLKQVVDSLPPEKAEPFHKLRHRLLKGITHVKSAGEQTQSLLTLSIQWVSDTVELIAQALVPEASTYNQNGARISKLGMENASSVRATTIEHDV